VSKQDKQYEISTVFVEKYVEAIAQRKPVLVEVRDHDSYEMERVKAIIARTSEELDDPHVLWIRNIHELLDPEPIAIQIFETYDEDDVRVSIVPRAKWEYYSGRESE